MDYQHQAHAANRSDLIKHLSLLTLRRWPGLATIWDAFAAAPTTPLNALAPGRRGLLSALMASDGPEPVADLQAILRSCRTPSGAACYPGSSQLLAHFEGVRKLILTDHNAPCIAAQNDHFHAAAELQIVSRQLDSYRQAEEVLQQGPDLVFIDPPFLQPQEWGDVMHLYNDIRRPYPRSRVVLWYPLREDLAVPTVYKRLPRIQLTVHFDTDQTLKGCAMVFLHFEPELLALLEPLARWFSESDLLGIRRVELSG